MRAQHALVRLAMQGCVLSPLLFNIFFAAVLNVVLQRFSEEPAILAELVHLKEPSTSMGPEPAMDYVGHAVWGMLYAEDACIVSRSPQGLAKMMEVIVEVCRAFGLTVSAKKTETMCMPPPRTPRTMVRIEAAGQIYKQVQSFTYLGGAVTETPDMSGCFWLHYLSTWVIIKKLEGTPLSDHSPPLLPNLSVYNPKTSATRNPRNYSKTPLSSS